MQLKFSIKSTTHYIPFLRRLVEVFDKTSSEVVLDHKAKMSCTLALVEAVNNAIFHAHKKKAEEWIDIFIQINKSKVYIEIHDNGEGFKMPETDVPPLEHTHGRGLFLINSLMNKVVYDSNKSNVLKMTYFL